VKTPSGSLRAVDEDMQRAPTIVCLSHLRWNFVFQRPQHLLTRCARERQVVFFEEPMYDGGEPTLELRRENGVLVATPHLAPGTSAPAAEAAQRKMLDRILDDLSCVDPVLWFYTPMPVVLTQHLSPRAVVYDCMDELSLFHNCPAELCGREQQLIAQSDVVFTGGHSLYRHKRATTRHPNIHSFPSSVDVAHFVHARDSLPEPADQAEVGSPRIGFFGVIDERIDLPLLAALADARPDWHIVLLGPVVKIDPETLPRRSNLYYLGAKTYQQLPSYLASWDVAILPFARNDATRFISPTKTPEYLAAGKPVVSTSITDVVTPYGRDGLAWIADTPQEFEAAIAEALTSDREARLAHADAFLADLSWDRTWRDMWAHVEAAMAARSTRATSVARVGSTSKLVHASKSRA
jgi:UDP-galactopyranose mutase